MRLRLLREIEQPVILETHGGWGRVYLDCYSRFAGCVFEKDPSKAEYLAKQRPTWAVYEADCIRALQAGAGAHLVVNFLDVDPYGDPWPVLAAYFGSRRPFASRLAVAVNDGLRQKVKTGGGWDVGSLADAVTRWGAAQAYKHYADICAELMQEQAARAGYRLRQWVAYYTGHAQQMTHYGAILER